MLNKLASIADFCDSVGEYKTADELTQLVKTSQLYDALRTLFDPAHSGLDRTDSYWKRVQRGLRRGKMDRGLGLLMAINVERTKLNRKIEELAKPIKDFGEQVNAFYGKLLASNNQVNAVNFKSELRELQSGLKSTLKLVAGRELKNALKLRERLSEQQLRALDKVKGLDPEIKENLAAVLRGVETGTMPQNVGRESIPGAPEDVREKKYRRSPTNNAKMTAWLKTLGIPAKSITDGAQSYPGLYAFEDYYRAYHYNPTAIEEFFDENPELDRAGVEQFGGDFGNLRAETFKTLQYDAKRSQEQPIPAWQKRPEPSFRPDVAGPGVAEPVSAIDEMQQEARMRSEEAAKAKTPLTPPVSTPEVKSDKPTKEDKYTAEIQKGLKELDPQRNIEQIKDFMRQRDRMEALRALQKEAPKEPEAPAEPIVAPKKESQLERGIRMLGRMREVQKFGKEFEFFPEPRKVVIRKYEGEYRVPSPDGREAGAYYTEDKDDAIATAVQVYGQDIEIKFRGSYPQTAFADDDYDSDEELWREGMENGRPELDYIPLVVDNDNSLQWGKWKHRLADPPLTRKGMDEDGEEWYQTECGLQINLESGNKQQHLNKRFPNPIPCPECFPQEAKADDDITADLPEGGINKLIDEIEYVDEAPKNKMPSKLERAYETLNEIQRVYDTALMAPKDFTSQEELEQLERALNRAKRHVEIMKLEGKVENMADDEEDVGMDIFPEPTNEEMDRAEEAYITRDKSAPPPHPTQWRSEDEDMAAQFGMENPDLDIYERFYPEGRERFNEEKHPNEEEVEYYKGRTDDPGDNSDYYTDEDDIKNLGRHSDLTPEDEDYEPPHRFRPEKERVLSKEEEIEKVVLMLNRLERQIKKLEGTEHTELLRRYRYEKELLLKAKKQLSGLPEGW